MGLALNSVLEGDNCIVTTAPPPPLCPNSPGSGDTNQDFTLNVLDSVAIIQFVLGNPISIPFDECFVAAGDGNGDGSLNVLDVVGFIQIILGTDCPSGFVNVPCACGNM